MMMTLFFFTVFLELIYITLFYLSKKVSGFRFWPPPKPRSWQFFTSWMIASIVIVNFLFLGLLDYDSFIFPHLSLRLPFAIGFFILGSGIGSWAVASFGLKNTIGVANKLVTAGPYQYSRNPQYIGDSLNIIGYAILTNSWMIWIIGLLGIALNFFAPHVEEPWLEEEYGESYLEYKKRVPRVWGRQTKQEKYLEK